MAKITLQVREKIAQGEAKPFALEFSDNVQTEEQARDYVAKNLPDFEIVPAAAKSTKAEK